MKTYDIDYLVRPRGDVAAPKSRIIRVEANTPHSASVVGVKRMRGLQMEIHAVTSVKEVRD